MTPHERRPARIRAAHGAGRGRGDPSAFSRRARRRGQGRRRRATTRSRSPITRPRRSSGRRSRAPIPTTASAARSTARSAARRSYTWVIDPIDGTRSFILGQMHWATLIALHDGEGIVVGVAHQPFVGESFMATAGGAPNGAAAASGARCRRADARASPTPSSPAPTRGCSARVDERAAFDRVADRARLTRWGGDCYAYCLLAMGLIDIVIEASLHAYDVQALMPIVKRGRRHHHGVDGRALRRRRVGRGVRRPALHASARPARRLRAG